MILRAPPDEADALRVVAHSMQNFAPSGFSWPQLEQVSTGDAIPGADAWVTVRVSGPEGGSQTAQANLRDGR